MSGCMLDIPKEKWLNYANSGDPYMGLRSAASDLGLQCLPVTRLEVSSLQWFKPCWSSIVDNNG